MSKYYIVGANGGDVAYETDDLELASTLNREYLELFDVFINGDRYGIEDFNSNVIEFGVAR